MKLEDMTPPNLAEAPDNEIGQAWLRLNQWYNAAAKHGKAVENYVNAAIWVIEAMGKINREIDPTKPLAQAALALKAKRAIPEDLSKALDSLPREVVLVHNFASIVGSAVSKSKDQAKDIDVLLRARRDSTGDYFEIQAENVWLPLRKLLSPDKSQPLHFIDNPQGPHADNIPIYSLVLRREEAVKQIIKSLQPGDHFAPEKPLMAGVTEYFDTKELWPWCQKKLKAKARLGGEVKYDGFRCVVTLKEGQVSAWFEDSQEDRASHLPELVAAIKATGYKTLILDGEMLATTKAGMIVPRTQLLEMLSGHPAFKPQYMVFDCLNLDGEDLSERPLGDRQPIIEAVVHDINSPLIKRSEVRKFSDEKGLEIIGKWAASQVTSEGLVVKDLTKPYHQGGSDDWAKFKTVFEIKVAVLEVENRKNGQSYLCGLLGGSSDFSNKTVKLSSKEYLALGKTFVTDYKAKVGDTLNVRIEELLVLNDNGNRKLAWGKPKVFGPDWSRPAYSVQQAIDLARRGHILKVEVGKGDVPAWTPKGAKIAFIAATPTEAERNRREAMVGVPGETFSKLYLDPIGLKKENVAVLYLVPEVLYEKGVQRGPYDCEVRAWEPHLTKQLYDLNPRLIVALGKQSARVLEDIIDAVMPHPAAVYKYGDSGEVARKLKKVMAKLQEAALEDLSEGGDTRSAVALRNYESYWQEMIPKQGHGRFVLHAHWRGLSKNELGLSHEELLKTNHSVHCDLRLEIDKKRLWGFTIFEGSTKEIQNKGQGFERLTHLPATDSLQGTWKLEQPHAWLTIAHDKPLISQPGSVGATSDKYAKFFELDCGDYDFSYARLHGREFFLHGSKMKGRVIIQYAPVADGARAWIINKPESQEPYTKTHTVESVLEELKKKGQEYLVWCSTPGNVPQILNVDSFLSKEYHAEILTKADSDNHVVCGVISEPDSIDAQGDRLSADEIKQMAEDFSNYVKEFRDRHTKIKVKVDLLKSRIAEKDFWFNGELIKKGSWWICCKVLDERIWSLIKRGIYKAFSIGGRGKRVPIRFSRTV